MNSNYQLTPESEFRYILTWFSEFSEYEKADFMAILIQWLLKNSEVCVNGLRDDMASSMSSNDGKPMSIFLCRVSWDQISSKAAAVTFDRPQVKLFTQWTPKWPDQLRSRLVDKLNEIDSEFGLKLNQALEDALKEEETTVTNGIDAVHNGVAMLAVTED